MSRTGTKWFSAFTWPILARVRIFFRRIVVVQFFFIILFVFTVLVVCSVRNIVDLTASKHFEVTLTKSGTCYDKSLLTRLVGLIVINRQFVYNKSSQKLFFNTQGKEFGVGYEACSDHQLKSAQNKRTPCLPFPFNFTGKKKREIIVLM